MAREANRTCSRCQALAHRVRTAITPSVAYLFFVDESGLDTKHCPYEVLAGVSVEDSRCWSLIAQIRSAELNIFGRRYPKELKGKHLLDRATFRHAHYPALGTLSEQDRVLHCRAGLDEGEAARCEGRPSAHKRVHLVALGQARVAFCHRVLELCAQHQSRFFASIVDCTAPRPGSDVLRKDYKYLFERFYAYLDNTSTNAQGIVVFDEIERSASHVLIGQMAQYFQGTRVGRLRAGRILPEPLFVHSDLTTLIFAADLIAYIILWGARIPGMSNEPRPELGELAKAVLSRRYRCESEDGYDLWSFKYIRDLRPEPERANQNEKAM